MSVPAALPERMQHYNVTVASYVRVPQGEGASASATASANATATAAATTTTTALQSGRLCLMRSPKLKVKVKGGATTSREDMGVYEAEGKYAMAEIQVYRTVDSHRDIRRARSSGLLRRKIAKKLEATPASDSKK